MKLKGRKAMTNLHSVLKSRDIILLTKVHLVKAIVFPLVTYRCKSWTIKEGWAPKYWSFSFSISPSNDYSGLISFRIDWFDLLAVPGSLKSLLQPHKLKASILKWIKQQQKSKNKTSDTHRVLAICPTFCQVNLTRYELLVATSLYKWGTKAEGS